MESKDTAYSYYGSVSRSTPITCGSYRARSTHQTLRLPIAESFRQMGLLGRISSGHKHVSASWIVRFVNHSSDHPPLVGLPFCPTGTRLEFICPQANSRPFFWGTFRAYSSTRFSLTTPMQAVHVCTTKNLLAFGTCS